MTQEGGKGESIVAGEKLKHRRSFFALIPRAPVRISAIQIFFPHSFKRRKGKVLLRLGVRIEPNRHHFSTCKDC